MYGYKIYKHANIQKDVIVVSETMGGPKPAKDRLNKPNIKNIDYFAFYKYSSLNLENPPFINNFKECFIKAKVFINQHQPAFRQKTKKAFKDITIFKIALNFDL